MNEISNLERHIRLCADKLELMEQNTRYRKTIEEIANYGPCLVPSLSFAVVQKMAIDLIRSEHENNSRRDSVSEQDFQPKRREAERDSTVDGDSLEQVRLGGAPESQALHAGRIIGTIEHEG